MIGKLTGTLLEKNPPEVLVDCAGVGYEVQVPMGTFYNLPAVGERVSLLTQFIVREDAQLLYGFATAPERAALRQLIKVSGVGPRMALGILSGMGVDDLAQAITLQEVGRLVKVPGIGKKTAERLVLELKDKVANLSFDHKPSEKAVDTSARVDVYAALMALGYAEKEINHVLKHFPNDLDVNNGIRWALQQFSK